MICDLGKPDISIKQREYGLEQDSSRPIVWPYTPRLPGLMFKF